MTTPQESALAKVIAAAEMDWNAPHEKGETLGAWRARVMTMQRARAVLGYLTSDRALRAIVAEVYHPGDPVEWEMDNARAAVLAALGGEQDA